MASPRSSPFANAVVTAMRKLYPESLADKSFDNTGLLLEAPHLPEKDLNNEVLLAIDLTTGVAEEAIHRRSGVIVAYHPIIFRGLKSLTFANTQQSSLLRLASEGISVYCPHTAVDAVVGGNADWLADIITTERDNHQPAKGLEYQFMGDHYSLFTFPTGDTEDAELSKYPRLDHKREPIVPNTESQGAGMGRLVTLEKTIGLEALLLNMTTNLGSPVGVSVAFPQGLDCRDYEHIQRIGVCAGSGASLLTGLDDVDLLLTGEMSHHDALAATEKGMVVVCLGHSNSERGYLHQVMRGKLLQELASNRDLKEPQVSVSEADRDPFVSLTRLNFFE